MSLEEYTGPDVRDDDRVIDKRCLKALERDGLAFQAVKCRACGKVHKLTSRDFVVFEGNVYVGADGLVMGADPSVFLETPPPDIGIYCLKLECLGVILSHVTEE